MDCEKFESTLVDELYGELDEVTSAAAKRHVSGCARCAALLGGLKATRRLAVLPIVEPPPDLEDRILSAARDAQKEVPMQRRLSRAISWAGSWAMRPQTAMAALFLLMIGSSALLLKGKAAKTPSTNVMVSEQGAPAPSAVTGTIARPADLEAADNAHGTPQAYARAEPAPPAPSLLPLPSAAAPAAAEARGSSNALEGLMNGGPGSGAATGSGGLGRATADDSLAQADPTPAARPYAAAPKAAAPPPAPAARKAAAADEEPPAAEAQATAPALPMKEKEETSDFDRGMSAYRAQSWAEAARLFDAAAAGGDLNAAFWAAQATEHQGGCTAAVTRYDQISAKGFGTRAGYDATLAAGRCYRQMGSYEAARQRLVRLLTVRSHAALAQQELDALAPKGGAKGAARAAPSPAAKPSASDAY